MKAFKKAFMKTFLRAFVEALWSLMRAVADLFLMRLNFPASFHF